MIIVFLQWDAQNYLTLYLFPIKRNSKIGFFFFKICKEMLLPLSTFHKSSFFKLFDRKRKKKGIEMEAVKSQWFSFNYSIVHIFLIFSAVISAQPNLHSSFNAH